MAYSERGSIMIVSIWILMILSLLAIGLAFRSSIELKLAAFHMNTSKAFYAARGAVVVALGEKEREYIEGKSLQIDALSEGWSRNEEVLKSIDIGECKAAVKYDYIEDPSEEPVVFYGMQDEYARININEAPFGTLKGLIHAFLDDEDDAAGIAGNIIDWRDEDNTPTEDGEGRIVGLEDYANLEKGYGPKNQRFRSAEELLLVEGVTDDLFSEIKDYITIFGDGKININTANRVCLDSLFGEAYASLGDKIVSWRNGVDGEPGTPDDRWFTKGPLTVIESEHGMVAVKNVDDEQWLDPFAGVTSLEWARVKALKDGIRSGSNIYRVKAEASVRGITKKVEAVIEFEDLAGDMVSGEEVSNKRREYSYLQWREE
ncbi:MAG: hypothetical protein AUJ75_01035 [Candidatus Omnitrophica bacterium CG1_02_49_10]|nr:MAG: hypothetical protein AUJ75_01035 [Candidatus Omnitrophica bacterium CG1_02_49_10]